MNYSAGFPVGAVPFKAFRNCDSCESIFPICGTGFWIWNTALGELSGRIILLISLKSGSSLRKNGWPLAFQLPTVNSTKH